MQSSLFEKAARKLEAAAEQANCAAGNARTEENNIAFGMAEAWREVLQAMGHSATMEYHREGSCIVFERLILNGQTVADYGASDGSGWR